MEKVAAFDQPDSLEGWVAIKEDPFTCNTIPPRLLFLVSWNEVDRRIAVTCRLRNRVVSDTEEHHGRSGLFSFQELRGIHDLLCLIHPSLTGSLPELPEELWGLWAYISNPEPPENIDDICQYLQDHYFPLALETCKEKLLMSTMFEEHCHDEYFENISELKRQGYDQAIRLAEEELKNVLFQRDNASSMSEMADVYSLEDMAVFKLNIALAQLYNYLLQPFLDLREVAGSKVREAKHEIQNPDRGERVRREFCDQLIEWQQNYEQALDMIQDNYMKYYAKTRRILKDVLDRLEADKKQYGTTSFTLLALDRYFRVKEDLCLENLQYLHNKKKSFVQERDKVKEMIASTDDKPGVKKELHELENQVFDWQIKIYDLHLEILREEERLAKTQKDAITRKIEAEEERVVFYDAVEDVEELSSDEDMPSLMITDPRLKQLNTKLKSINTRRAKLRTKRNNLQTKVQTKEYNIREAEEKFKQHHFIQTKRDFYKEEMERKQSFIEEERKRTIDRLKTFKVKYPTPATIKPPRYQPPSKKKEPPVKTTKKVLTNSEKTLASSRIKPQSDKNISDKQTSDKNKTYSVRSNQPIPRPRNKPGDGDNTDGISVTIYESPRPPGSSSPIPEEESGNLGNVKNPDSGPQSMQSVPVPPPPVPMPPPPCVPPPAPPPPPPPPPAPMAPAAPPPLNIGKTTGKPNSLQALQNKQKEAENVRPNLQDIQQGRKGLKSAADRPEKPKAPSTDPMQEMVNLIKKGVKLRPMKERQQDDQGKAEPPRPNQSPSEDHMKLLVESLNRISVFTRESSPESDSDDGEFDD